MSNIPVKNLLPSTRAAYSAMCRIKWTTRLKQTHCWGAGRRRRLQFKCL